MRLILTFAFKFKGLLILGLFFGILTFFAAQLITKKYLVTSERIGLTGRFQPSTLPDFILEDIGDGLTQIDESGTTIPNLASSWETSDKGKTWVFHLKEDLFWQDGKKLTSEKIKYNFYDVEVEYSDDMTISFKLKDPFVPFPTAVTQPVFKKGLLGTGEWKVDKIIIRGEYIHQLTIKKGQERKIYKFYPTEDKTKLAFKLGDVDKIIQIFNPDPLQNWNTTKVEKNLVLDQNVTIFFNTKEGFSSEKQARQALYYAIDKEKLAEDRSIGPLSPNSWAYNPQVKPYNYDPSRTKELIEDLPKEIKDNLPFKLVTTPLLLPVAEKIARDWENVGIKTTVLVSSVVPSTYDGFLVIFDTPKDPDQYSLWHSTQVETNISKYTNPRINKLLEEGRVELDREERKKIYLDFQRFLAEDAPSAFLYHPTWYTIERK